MNNSPEYSDRYAQLYHDIKEMTEAGYSNRAIAKKLHCSRATVLKYANGDYEALYRRKHASGFDKYADLIVKSLSEGMCKADVYRLLQQKGCPYKKTAALDYMNKLIKYYGIEVSVNKSTSKQAIQEQKKINRYDHFTRTGIFHSLWMGTKLTDYYSNYLFQKYPILFELKTCIQEFREIFDQRNMPMLYLFIDKYKNSDIKGLARFTKGLERDIDAVENAVASDLSNGFVEGTNNKLKMIKRTMYGRCNIELLKAKLMYVSKGAYTDNCG